MGCVLQDNRIEVLMAATNPEPYYNNPLEVGLELLVIFHELRLRVPMGLERLTVESNS